MLQMLVDMFLIMYCNAYDRIKFYCANILIIFYDKAPPWIYFHNYIVMLDMYKAYKTNKYVNIIF
jgi:hypothetical protein